MMKITVNLGEPIRRRVGRGKITVELGEGVQTLADLMAEMERSLPGFKEEMEGEEGFAPYRLFFNDTLVRSADLADTEVKEGDSVTILMAMAGG